MEFVNLTARTDGHEVVCGILPQIFVVFESRAKLIGGTEEALLNSYNS